ncbi:hypothetical protein BDR03DRAFT_946922 [Suillus americanus]|nr:hypothetical protein BDR03DRAFT_946922 [Suillus americanus]
MPQSFVVAKFMPERSASWTSSYGLKKATSWTTRPFLALRISRTDVGLRAIKRGARMITDRRYEIIAR